MFGAKLTGSVWGRDATNQIFQRGGFAVDEDIVVDDNNERAATNVGFLALDILAWTKHY